MITFLVRNKYPVCFYSSSYYTGLPAPDLLGDCDRGAKVYYRVTEWLTNPSIW